MILVHEVVCEKSCCPTNVVLEKEASPICGMIIGSNRAVAGPGDSTAEEGDETHTMLTEYYLNAAFR